MTATAQSGRPACCLCRRPERPRHAMPQGLRGGVFFPPQHQKGDMPYTGLVLSEPDAEGGGWTDRPLAPGHRCVHRSSKAAEPWHFLRPCVIMPPATERSPADWYRQGPPSRVSNLGGTHRVEDPPKQEKVSCAASSPTKLIEVRMHTANLKRSIANDGTACVTVCSSGDCMAKVFFPACRILSALKIRRKSEVYNLVEIQNQV